MAIKSKVAINVANRSGFDKSFRNLLTAKCGTLVPVLVDEVIPGTRVHLKGMVSGSLAPLASETFMNVQYRLEAFFVPYRLLYGGFEDWICQNSLGINEQSTSSDIPALPRLGVIASDPEGEPNPYLAPGSLADYLGYVIDTDSNSVSTNINMFPFLAYHKIYDDWYRNSRVQRSVFTKMMSYPPSASYTYLRVGNIPYCAVKADSYRTIDAVIASEVAGEYTWVKQDKGNFCDGVNIMELRQRNFDDDYFTMSMPQAQQGTAQSVSFATNQSTGSFTISQLRAANSLQQFLERNALCGNRYVDYVKAHYGADLSDGIAQRSLYLGRSVMDIYSKGVFQSADGNNSGVNTPFSSVASRYGSPYFAGNDTIIDDFVANEYGVIMVIGSVVPRVTYSTGIRKYLLEHFLSDNSRAQIADPLLQNVGNQPIYARELDAHIDSRVFGYIDRFAEWMTKHDELHGLLKDGQSLQSFALQRSFDYDAANAPVISTSFLKIPTDFLDQVSAVSSEVSTYGAWIDHFFDYKVSMPLAEYSMPSLQDPAYEHGHTVVIDRNGKHL